VQQRLLAGNPQHEAADKKRKSVHRRAPASTQ
jgi:hypothetical protein